MKTINVRQLLREFNSIFPLPADGIKVDRRDGDSFYIYPKSLETPPLPIDTPSEIPEEHTDEIPPEVPSIVMGYCQGLFEKGLIQKTTRITYEDENGNPTIKDKMYCDKCIKRLEEKGIGRVYYL